MLKSNFIINLFAGKSLASSGISFLRKMSGTAVEPKKRNIEIKARIANDAGYAKRVEIAKTLTKTAGEVLKQRDVFYKVSNGRLKLRVQDGTAMLIQYGRPDVSGPKLSEFDILDIAEPEKLDRMLSNSLGVIGEVKKSRYLFLHEQTRIHLDKVDGLGTFLEFEVCLRPEQTIEDGTIIANDLMKLFEINDTDLMTGAYMDELLQK
ncbi:uncharacterized protein LOC129567662 [Sitodiplosis mosellana]|uniref:uncharacterized protein LOC129567662 n=1 Tax=Sitodiplosis mosellana TaxID=263140 RepID=UPI0024447F99|nr:uncharacterized protein LOC129567662 [Sitodiplosis mosellana]